MDLNSIYAVATAINRLAEDGQIRYEDIDEAMVINIDVTPTMHYGIDKELYRLTHGGEDEGFIHSSAPIEAQIDKVRFVISQKSARITKGTDGDSYH